MSWSLPSNWHTARGRLFVITFILTAVCLLFASSTVHETASSTWNNWLASNTGTKDNLLSFRERLAKARPSNNTSNSHSRNLGVFDDIFVLSLDRRADRRVRMDVLKRALGLTFSYVPATEADSAAVSRIKDELETRATRTAGHFTWPSNTLPVDESSFLPFRQAGAELWTQPSDAPPTSDTEPPPKSGQNSSDIPSFMTRPRIATWHSHMSIVRQVADAPDPNYAALVLEDDVDIDWGIEARVKRAWPALPPDWDMVFLGHCPSRDKVFDARRSEAHFRPLNGAPELRPSFAPLCTHAYALSRDGARRLLTQLRYELFAYSKPIDNGYSHLIYQQRVKSFSFLPAVVAQVRDGMSDIWGFDMSTMDTRDDLVDSTLERIALLKELENAADQAQA